MLTTTAQRQGDSRENGNGRLIDDPLTFLAEEHLGHRQICAYLMAIAGSDQIDFEKTARSLAFLRHEFLLHDADERSSLYPMLRKRCEPEDEIELLIERLMADHDYAREAARPVASVLERVLEGETNLNAEDRNRLLVFADKVKRYITLENAVIIPLARVRLTEEDKAKLVSGMLMRRGVVQSPPKVKTQLPVEKEASSA